MGNAIKALGAPREHYILSTKLFWSKVGGANRLGLTMKHIFEGIRNSLKRL